MTDLGVISWHQICKQGYTQNDVRRALGSGDISREREGWYSTPGADDEALCAVRASGVLTCLSALRKHGLWVPRTTDEVHVRAKPAIHRKNPKRFCRTYSRPFPEGDAIIDDVVTAFMHAVRCLDDEGTVVVADSILQSRTLTMDELATALAAAPRRIRRLLDRCDPNAESGIETMVRLRLQSKGIGAKSQVDIPGVGRVDFVIGNRLIIEVDGEQYHASRVQFMKDRSRDRHAVALGYIVIRLTYWDVVTNWSDAEVDILTVVRSGAHLRRVAC